MKKDNDNNNNNNHKNNNNAVLFCGHVFPLLKLNINISYFRWKHTALAVFTGATYRQILPTFYLLDRHRLGV